MADNTSRYLPIPQAAVYAGVSESQFRRLIGRGLIPTIKPGGQRRPLVDREQIDRLMAKSVTRTPGKSA